MFTLERKVAALLTEHGVAPSAGPVFCGLSGGADSVALVLVMKALDYDVRALHCNFQLRGEESERDECFVRNFCARHAVPLQTVRFDTRAEAARTGESIEMAARRLRYAWFEEMVRATPATDEYADSPACRGKIAVAHHADDNVETMLLNLIRGAGLHGLTGMDFCNDRGVLRPLLTTTRDEIIGFLTALGQDYVTDSTNTDTHYRRNKIRHELLPLLRTMNPSIDSTLTQTMGHLREAEHVLLDGGEEDMATYRQTAELLRMGFSSTQIEQMRTAENGAFTIAQGTMLTKHRGELVWGPVPETLEPTPVVAQRVKRSEVQDLRNPQVGVFDVRAVRGEMVVRSVREGDRFHPYGMKGTKLVSDYLTDRHRSRIEKMNARVVCDDEGILWLVGERIDQRAAVVSDTTEVFVV